MAKCDIKCIGGERDEAGVRLKEVRTRGVLGGASQMVGIEIQTEEGGRATIL